MDIKVARRAAGMTQAQLAAAANVSQPNLSAYENGRRSPTPEVVDRIRSALEGRPSVRLTTHREALLGLLDSFHATRVRVVGSIARGQDRPGSDVDLLVDFTDEASLLDEIGLRLAVTDLLQVPVDVIAADTLREPVRARLLAEAVPV